jgi:hypothetical protein
MNNLAILVCLFVSLKTFAQSPFYPNVEHYLPKKSNISADSRGAFVDSVRIYNFGTVKDSTLYETRINTAIGNSRVLKFYTPARKVTYKDSFFTTPKVSARYTYRENLSKPKDSLQLVSYEIEYYNTNKKRDSSKTATSTTSSGGLYELVRYKTRFLYNAQNKLIKDSLYESLYPKPLAFSGYSNYEYDTNGSLKKITTTNFSKPSSYTNFTYPDAYTEVQETSSGTNQSKIQLKYYDTQRLFLKELTFFSPNAQGQMEITSIIYLQYDKNNNLIRVEGDYSKYNSYSIEQTIWDACNQEKRFIANRGTSLATLKLVQKSFYYKDCLKSGTIDQPILEGVSIFPNPTNNELFIDSEKELTKIEVRNIMGNIVFKSAQNLNQIDLSHLSSGIYILTVYANQEYKAMRFVKE